MCKFRPLTKDEIEVRIGVIKDNGCQLLLYKDARTDMNILDETVGSVNWQNKFYEHKGILFCSLGINTNYAHPELPERWIWKDDAGVESNTEAEKGNASDARKRAGVAWGIGRELYTAPFILISSRDCSIQGKKCYDKFIVDHIKIENGEIIELSIHNSSANKTVYSWSKKQPSKAKPKPEPKTEPKVTPEEKTYTCSDCGATVNQNMAGRTLKTFGVILCKDCGLKRCNS